MTVSLSFSLIGKTVNFSTNASPILGVEVRNAKVLGILDPGSAKAYDDIVAKHIQVYPYLPEGTPDSPYDYPYVKLAMADGTEKVFGLPWIQEGTIQIVDTTTLVVVLKNRGQSDINLLRQSLLANGFEDFTIEVKS
jgi:hypothetical protein